MRPYIRDAMSESELCLVQTSKFPTNSSLLYHYTEMAARKRIFYNSFSHCDLVFAETFSYKHLINSYKMSNKFRYYKFQKINAYYTRERIFPEYRYRKIDVRFIHKCLRYDFILFYVIIIIIMSGW